MAGRSAVITQRDVQRILAGAQKAGITMSIVVTGAEVKFIPVDGKAEPDSLTALDKWRANRDARKAKAPADGRSRR